jgi:phage terminase large subunit GpA-like protein
MSAIQGFYDGLKPIPITLISDWSDKNMRLSSESSAEPGPFRTSRTPYIREILECLSPNSPVTELIAMKGVQLAFTTAGLCMMACYADIAPCPIMYVMPTIDVAKGFSETRVDPMIEHCEALREKIRPNRERDSGNTKFVKKFPGGYFIISGANSAASLRSRAIRILILDEIDAYLQDVNGEGSPIKLAEKRQATFGLKKKTLKISTPTLEHTSAIEPAYLKTDQRKYFVPCPHCGSFQELKFQQLTWEPGKTDTVYYECIDCKELIEERFKTRMLAAGEWRPTKKENITPLKRGYHINSLYAPIGWLSWADIAADWEDAQDDDNKLKTFVNTILGETWKEKGEVPEWKNLYNRAENYALNRPPKEVCFIVAGVDVQGNRLEVHIMGFGKNKVSYSLDYRVIHSKTSSTTDPQVWEDLGAIVNETWVREDDVILPLRLMAIDTGYNTQTVYDFCRKFDASRVIPIKGKDKLGVAYAAPRAIDTTRAGKKIGRTKVWQVGVSVIKSEIYGWLKQEIVEGKIPTGYMHFPRYDENFFRGLTAEQYTPTTNKKGFKVYEWIKKYHFNEPLDTTVYARAAAAVVGIDRMSDAHLDAMVGNYSRRQSTGARKPKKKKSSFWD